MAGRLLEVTLDDPYANVAFEEALLRSGAGPTLRVWSNQRSVVIGRAQLAKAETDVEFCRQSGIPVVRRCSAGGAVYNGPGNINWTFSVPNGALGVRERMDANVVFARFAPMVVDALARCGVRAKFVPPNSVSDERGKVSGMAAYLSTGNVLCHGTLLFDADLEEVARLTTPRQVEVGKRYPRSNVARVSNAGVDPEEFAARLAGSMGGFDRGEPTDAERAALAGLIGKYRSAEWNLGDPFP